eukprot:7453201-Pyramimonas_sp.AAC.1
MDPSLTNDRGESARCVSAADVLEFIDREQQLKVLSQKIHLNLATMVDYCVLPCRTRRQIEREMRRRRGRLSGCARFGKVVASQ